MPDQNQIPDRVTSYRPIQDLIPAHWSSNTVEANGIRQHYYRTGGNKPAVVLLHGILMNGLTWLQVAQRLEAAFDVIMPDARGHGQSQRTGEQFSIATLVADVAGLIRALDLERPLLVGHSLGGMTAAFVAATYPDLAGALVLEDAMWGDRPALSPETMQSDGYQQWYQRFLAYLENLKSQSHPERLVAAYPYLPPHSTMWPEAEYVPYVEAQAQLDLDLVRSGASLWSVTQNQPALRELMPDIRCPVLIMTGQNSFTDPQVTQQVLEAGDHCEHVSFENAGHLIHLDAFEPYLETLFRFLQKAGK